jgi:hypothetical protein
MASDASSSIAGYTPVSDVSNVSTVGTSIEAVAAALKKVPRDWSLAIAAYGEKPAGGYSLREIVSPPAGGDELFNEFSAYHGSNDYVHEFVLPALSGTATLPADLAEKAREELTMKGIVLQGVLMASWSNLHKATSLCSESKVGNSDGAPHYVDRAWALYANNENNGPIKLAEKRAPQFATETTPFTEAGSSKVNVRLLALFTELQTAAQQGNCTSMRSLVKASIAQMQVPVIQGMLREAYEVDPKEVEGHQGADGFMEVVEGWAFARAVIPSIAKCSTAAAETIKANMDTIALGTNGPHLKDGYVAVKAAVESTYPCLGISCSDVNAMINPFKTGQTLWQPCSDGGEGDATSTSTSTTTPPINPEVSAAGLQAQLLTRIAAIALVMPWLWMM